MMILRRAPRSIALTATAVIGALALSACGGSSSAKGSDGNIAVADIEAAT